jgi:GrpB-like predicted nucleotidyltransferase (UPF0157 family)
MIELVAYNPEWPKEFDGIASRISQVMDPLALRVDHIGSPTPDSVTDVADEVTSGTRGELRMGSWVQSI